MVVDAEARTANRRLLRHLGFGRVPDDVGAAPDGPARPAGEVLDRALALHVVVAVAGGLDGEAGWRWLDGLGAGDALAPGEADYLQDAAEGIRVEDAARATQAEALAVLVWALGLIDDLPPDGPATEATAVLPGAGRPVDDAVVGADVRPIAELEALHDLLAGMAWALRADPDLEVGAAPGSLDPYVVRQRLAALRWLLGEPPV
jgi:Domain of unknown function (DUF4272)